MIRILKVKTNNKTVVTNITDLVRKEIQDIREGIVQVSIPHTTAAVFMTEDDEELREDYIKIACEALAHLRPFKHIRKYNPNTEAHVFSSLLGTSINLSVHDGALMLGTYQNIMLLEMDGPKERTVNVSIFPFD